MAIIHINGSNGYIGSSVAAAFPRSTHADLCWFSGSNPVDFADSTDIEKADVIIHLAGHSSEPMCSADPHGAWNNNVVKFKHLLERLRDDQLLIYASSASVYASQQNAVTEESFVSSSRPYDCTKIIIDALAQMYINQGKMIVGLRFGTVAGLSPVLRIDTIINSMTNSALKNGTINCVDPTVRRTMLFIPDIIQAIRMIIDKPASGIFNLGSINTTVGDIGLAISRLLDVELNIEHRSSNFYNFHLDSSRFVNQFGLYHASSLADIVNDLKDNLHLSIQGRRDVAPAH
jgi:nucleoside-diphosphate-sugar epimerase